MKKPKHQELPIDIVHEILVRLKVKILTRFKIVSKSWHSLISDTSFQQDHYRRHLQQDPLLLLTRCEFSTTHRKTMLHLSTYNSIQESPISSFSVGVTQRYSYPLMTLSCQGLVCICEPWQRNILLCNPSTREIIALPPSSPPSSNVGFGYAASAQEFKVAWFGGLDSSPCCKVFTLGTSGWREARSPPPKHRFMRGAPFVHGAIHLLPNLSDKVDGIDAFDIETEEYRKIPLPEYYYQFAKAKRNSLCVYLKELGGFLCLVFDFKATMELWILKDYDSGMWVKEYTIALTSLGYDVSGDAIAIMGDGSILLNTCDRKGYESLYFYNPGDKTFNQKATGKYSASLYTESLLPLGRVSAHKPSKDVDLVASEETIIGLGHELSPALPCLLKIKAGIIDALSVDNLLYKGIIPNDDLMAAYGVLGKKVSL